MEKKQNTSSILEQMDLYSIIRDVIRNLWVILLAALAVGLIVYMSIHAKSQTTYTTKATFVVTARTSGNYTSTNLSTSTGLAENIASLLNSNLMKKMVCKDLEMETFEASASAGVVKGTNLMTLSVTAETPYGAYRVIRSIMNNINNLTGYVSGEAVLSVLQEPQVPTKADAHIPARARTTKACILAACAFAAAFVWLSFRKETIRTERDIETKLEAKPIGIVYADGDRNPLRDLWNRYVRKKQTKLLVTELAAKFDFVEHYKKISANIAGQAQKSGAKVILVTSVREHEGKSTVSANIALSLARQSHQVLLIDGDMRRPTQQSLFLEQNEELKTTLGDLLLGKTNLTDALRYDEKRGIYLLLNEHNYSNSTDIVSSENMARLLEVVRKAFDYVIIDSPPMALMADAEVLADRSDLSILVVNYDLVTAPDLNDAIDSLRDCRGEFAGCILNNVHTLPGERRAVVGSGGYGRYGHYGRYGKYGKYGSYGQYGQYGHYVKDGESSAK